MSARIRFGAFLPPFHPQDEHPAVQLERDLELCEWMDRLHFDEFWMGEHHSGGWEINASSELFIAAAAQRTRSIKLGMGVATVPYHNPLMLADRVRQLDYLTRGRLMFGVGAGSLPSDAFMMGIPTPEVRQRLDQSLDVLVRLLRGETVTAKTDWFHLQDAHLQLLPYSEYGVEIAVANQISPVGSQNAGRHGLSILSLAATSAGGFNALASNWAIAEQVAQEHKQTVRRSRWRLVGPVHIAETRVQARANVEWGLKKWIDYASNVAVLPIAPPPGIDPVDALVNSGFAVIGTPDDLVAQVERLNTQSGGFGSFLTLHTPWADWEQTKKSYELIARYVMPKVNGINRNREMSRAWVEEHNVRFRGELQSAVAARLEQHRDEKGGENISQDMIDALRKK